MKLSKKFGLKIFFYVLAILMFYSDFSNADARSEMLKRYDMQKQKLQKNYETAKNKIIADWSKKKKEIEKLWPNFKNSTNKELVNYSEKLDARAAINFETGVIEIETIISDKDINQKEKQDTAKTKQLNDKAINKIITTTKDIINIETTDGKKIIADQLDLQNQTPAEFIENKVLPNIEIQTQKNKTNNSTVKIAKIKIPLNKNHILIRAKKYEALVLQYSKKYNIQPEFLFAIMETESCFNPFAISPVPAFGLMQIVPNSAGKDVSYFLYKKKQILTKDELFEPEINIEYGATYIYLLRDSYLKNFQKHSNNLTIIAAAYNCGPGTVQRILKNYSLDKLDNAEFYEQLKKRLPKETKNYIDSVNTKKEKYKKLIID